MSKKFIHLTSGWIPVSMLCLLAIALVTGQARANLDAGDAAAPFTSSGIPSIQAPPEDIETLRLWVEAYLDVPDRIQLTIDATLQSPASSRRWGLLRGQGADHE